MRIFAAACLIAAAFPAAAAAADIDRLLGSCAGAKWPDLCALTLKSFPDDWKAANNGDYQGQRNVAYCLSYGCDGAVVIDKDAGCAWRMVILASGAIVDSTDIMNYQVECRSSGKEALAMARLLFRRIYRKSMPPLQ